ncbi:MAG: hypothetical protein E6J62_03260 [Deltaproteobacteria bacterium]|nr:MAG: hypothetical protein E6J62_03260 [Deltaproteobacteria bacterium]
MPTFTAAKAPRGKPRTCTRLPGRSAEERPTRGFVVVLFVADDLDLLAHLLAARRNAVDLVLVVGDVRAVRDVLVGDDERLAVLHLVGEAGSVHDRTDVVAAELAVASVVDALVGSDVADGKDELVLHRVEDLARASSGNAVGVVAFAQRGDRRRSRRGAGSLGGGPDRSCRLGDGRGNADRYQKDCKRTDHALASLAGRAYPGSKKERPGASTPALPREGAEVYGPASCRPRSA